MFSMRKASTKPCCAFIASPFRPERFRPACETVLSVAVVPVPEVASYAEETPDVFLREAVRHWQGRDAPEFEEDCV